MALKSLLFVSILVALMAAQISEAQLLPSFLLRVNGTLFCTATGNAGVNVTAPPPPPFPNATVQLQCGPGNVVATTTTNGSGFFSLGVTLNPLSPISISNCSVIVTTPLVTCNATLPSTGTLTSLLSFLGLSTSTAPPPTFSVNTGPAGFSFRL